TKMHARYIRLALQSAEEILPAAESFKLSGMNITSPFKEQIFNLLDSFDRNASETGSVNTIVFKKGRKPKGFNTDVEGVKGCLEERNTEIKGARALVIGGGGAAISAAYALISLGADITIANRTLDKAKRIGMMFGCEVCSLSRKDISDAVRKAEILVSAVSTTKRIVPKEALRKGTLILEAYYSNKTALSSDAIKAGCTFIGGLNWLLHQGVISFEIMVGKKAPIAAMRKALQKTNTLKSNIALIGFMGCGKSSISKKISSLYSLKNLDIDEQIEKSTRQSIPSIFKERGEEYFRRLEKKEIAKASEMRNVIISCGGGAVLNQRNMRILAKNSWIVWLHADPKECIKRIKHEHNRPLLFHKKMFETGLRIFEERKPLYAANCDFAICTENKKIDDIARLINYEISISK
ncbi:MAG: shikimate kinase, partial [Candidatus Anstonellaceae archaeon]